MSHYVSFRVNYEGYWHAGAFADVTVELADGGKFIITATDRTDQHQNTSLTNRVERVMFIAWEAIGKPLNVQFIEHNETASLLPPCDHEDYPTEFDEVTFDDFPKTVPCRMSGKDVGPQFGIPHWKRIKQ